jgi:hypothetical protein
MRKDPRGTTKLIASLAAILALRPGGSSRSSGRTDAGRRLVATAMGGYVVERS